MKRTALLSVWLVLGAITEAGAQSQPGCSGPHPYSAPWKVGNAVLFRTPKLNVDADGAPNSYLVNGNGLSYTCDGVVAVENGQRVTPKTDKAHWQEKCRAAWVKAVATGDYQAVDIFGFLTDKDGVPIVQGGDDPLPGTAYVSATSVVVPGAPAETQRRYVDATRVPYVVLPAPFRKSWAIKSGAVAIVYRPKTDAYAFAVFGDDGDFGEASVRTHRDLGSDPIQLSDGVLRAKARVEDPILTVVFPSRVSAPRADVDAWVADIHAQGEEALAAFGGKSKLAACAH